MDLNKKTLEENLTRLLYLASILKEKNHVQYNYWIDYAILSNLELMVNNFNNLGSQVSDEIL